MKPKDQSIGENSQKATSNCSHQEQDNSQACIRQGLWTKSLAPLGLSALHLLMYAFES